MKDAIRKKDSRALMQKINQTPYAHHLGVEIIELSEGFARARVEIADNLRNLFGLVHGGAICSLADQAFAACANSLGRPAVAIAITINFVSPTVDSKELVAEGRVIHRGRTTCLAQATVCDDTGRLVASFSGTGLFVDGD